MTTIEIGPHALHLTDSGGDGPAVLLSHGFFMDATMFEAQVAALSPAFRCVAVDARGFGSTVAEPTPFSYWDSADDLVAVLDELGIERAVLVGMSQGGFTSLRAALAHPDRVAGLVLIDTDAEHYDEGTQAAYRQVKDGLLANGWTDEFAGSMADTLFGPGYDTAPWRTRWQAYPPEQLAEPFEAMITRDDIKPRLGEITCPTLILHGELDGSIPLASAEAVRDGLGGPTTLTVVPGAGHSSNLENPVFVNAAIADFLATVDHGGAR